MTTANIQPVYVQNQDAMEGINNMHITSIRKLSERLVMEYATNGTDGFSLDVHDLPIPDQRLLLSHVLDSDQIEEIYLSDSATRYYMQEEGKFLQRFVSEECRSHYSDCMEEMEMRREHHADNNESYWRMR